MPLRRRGSALAKQAADALSRRVREIYATADRLSNRATLVELRQCRKPSTHHRFDESFFAWDAADSPYVGSISRTLL